MGILESCELGGDERMNVSINNNFFRESAMTTTKYTSEDYYYKESKIKLFGDIFYKKIQSKTEFVLQTYFVNRNSEVINHALKIYEDSNSFIL
jgi:hypothetical protein